MADDPDSWSIPAEGTKDSDVEKCDSCEDGDSATGSLLTELDSQLLRGVSLAVTLSGFGRHWSSTAGTTTMYQTGPQIYNLSSVVKEFDTFLSHDWQTNRWLKVLALLWIFNLRAATVISLCFSICWGTVLGLHWLPDEAWYIFFPWCVFFLVLLSWQRLRSLVLPKMVFMDKLCIAQHDAILKAQGIVGLAAFLDRSKTLTILWSPKYFTRLWCIYELATYLRQREHKPVKLMPVAMSVVMLLMCIGGMLLMTPYELGYYYYYLKEKNIRYVRGSQGGIHWPAMVRTVAMIVAVAVVLVPVVFWVGIHVMRDIQNLKDQLQDFSIRKSKCFCCCHEHQHPETGEHLPCDRVLVYKMLKIWYSTEGKDFLDSFDDVVRAELSAVALQGAKKAQLPFQDVVYLAMAISATELQKAVQGFVQEANFQGFPDGLVMIQAAFEFLAKFFLNYLTIWLLYLWLIFELCSFGPYLMKRTNCSWSRLLAALVLSLVMFLTFGSFWFITNLINAVVREHFADDLPMFSSLFRLLWLLLPLGLLRWNRRRAGL